MEKYDAIIIGAGQAGMPLSMAMVQAGWKTALVEGKHVGGTCINEGCTPTKTMVASAEVAEIARRTAEFGVLTGAVSIDMGRVKARKDEIVDSFRSGDVRRIKKAGVNLIDGQARFSGPKTLEVRLNDGNAVRQLTSEMILINTGGRPSIPRLAGLETVRFLDSTSIMDLEEVPDHLLVLGGGYVALEFGQMFRRFGSQVTLVERSDQLLAQEDADVANAMLGILREDGIEVLLGSAAVSVGKDPKGDIELTVITPDGERRLHGSHLLVATGRTPNTESLNLAAVGVEMGEKGVIKVNQRLETNVPGIYALGDVNGGPAFTHISYDDFRIIKTNLLDGGSASTRGRLVPYTVFTDPQLGRIGLSEKEAQQQGRKFHIARVPMTYSARALETGRSRGLIKALVDVDTRQILGAAVLAVDGGELMAMIEIAMLGKLPYTTLRDAIFAHPTLAEVLNTLFMGM